jgi:hypothetical protein
MKIRGGNLKPWLCDAAAMLSYRCPEYYGFGELARGGDGRR